jgi:hypothetical protein
MDTVRDFEDILVSMQTHRVRYLVIGGLAFIHHAKPRYTKDIDIWVDPSAENIERANQALAEFGSPYLMEFGKSDEVVQVGLPSNRIDLIQTVEGMSFETAWEKRDLGPYGRVTANWIDIDSLISVKARIPVPRHQQDVRDLLKVREMRKSSKRKTTRRSDIRPVRRRGAS